MEQKKILWVVVFVSAFILIIFGAALYLYAPFRNKSTMNASEIADLGRIQTDSEKTDIDPVQWSRDPSSIPPLETETSPPVNIINNNYTYVNGETQSSKEDGSVNVSSLTDTEKPERETAALPESLAKEINQAAGNASAEKKEADLTVKKAATGVTAKKGTLAISEKKAADKTKQTVKQNTQNKLPSKSVTKTSKMQNTLSKKTVETIYWVQTASLTSRINAENARDTLTAKHMNAEIFTKETATGITHRVRVGPFKNKTEADYWLKRVREIKGFEGSYVSQDRKKE